MRGLEIRIAYAKAMLAHRINPSDSTQEALAFIVDDAWTEGIHDYQAGICESPMLLRDTPDLMNSWAGGYDWMAQVMEMHECENCNNSSGNPCFIHG